MKMSSNKKFLILLLLSLFITIVISDCPKSNFNSKDCINKGGKVKVTIKNGCQTEICVLTKKITKKTTKKATIKITTKKTTKNCPIFTVDNYGCTQKGGRITSYTSEGCATPTCVVEATTTTKLCPVFSVDNYGCTQKGGRITSYTSEGCATPTCVVEATITAIDEILPTRIPCPLYAPIGPYCTEMGGRPSAVIDENGCPHPTCVTESIKPTTTTKPCPIFSVDTSGCYQKGGSMSFYTSEGCSYPTCVVEATTTTIEEITPTKEPCPEYEPVGPYCTEMGGTPTAYTDEDGCLNPYCKTEDDTPTTTTTKQCPTFSVDTYGCTQKGGTITSYTSEGCATPTCIVESAAVATKLCETFSFDNYGCTQKGGTVTSYTSDGCATPTCVVNEVITPRVPCPLYKPMGPYCREKGGILSSYTDENGCYHPICITESITPTTTTKQCPTFSVDTYGCTQKGGTISFYTSEDCSYPTCVVEATTTTVDEMIPTRIPCPLYAPIGPDCMEMGGTPSVVIDENGCPRPICVTESIKPTTTTKPCPIFSVDTSSCYQKGGSMTFYTSEGCSYPTCVVDEIIPTIIPCPRYVPVGPYCTEMGGRPSAYKDSRGCSHPTCIMDEITATPAPTHDEITNEVDEIDTTTELDEPFTTSSTEEIIPPIMRCPRYVPVGPYCTRMGGRPSAYKDSRGCSHPTCIMDGVTATPIIDEITNEVDEIDSNTELDEPTSISEEIPIFIRCPEFFFNRQACIERGGRPSSYTFSINDMSCSHPTCIMDEIPETDAAVNEENTSTLDETTTTTTTLIPTLTKNCPMFKVDVEGCNKKGGTISSYMKEGCSFPTCVVEEPIPTPTITPPPPIVTPTPKECPMFKVDVEGCNKKGGTISSYMKEGCSFPTCVVEEPIPTPTITPPPIVTPTPKECPMFKVDVEGCNKKGGRISSYMKDGCSFPTCIVEEPIPTPTITLPPIFTSKLCPMFKIDFEGCTRKGGIMSSVMRDGCSYPTCVIKETTPTSIPCPMFRIDIEGCTRKGGIMSSYMRNGCSYPTCVIEETTPTATTIVTPPPPPTNPCPQVAFSKLSCTKKGGRVTYRIENGCQIPVCENIPFEMGAF